VSTRRRPLPRIVPSGPVADTAIDYIFFVLGGAGAVWLVVLLVRESFHFGWLQLAFSIVFWVLLAYLVLPRLHSILARIYVPNYFIGRTRTSDGLLGDPVNLALVGSEAQLHDVMNAAGWTMADDVTLRSGLRIVRSTLLRTSYLEAPVSPLMLFGRDQDFAYQQEVDGTPGKRHHVRFWRCPPDWRLPGGRAVEWLAAGTYDRSVGFSLFTLQITHKIDENTDVERDHIVTSVKAANGAVTVHVIRDFSTGYHARNGGGDSIATDGDLPVIDLATVKLPRGASKIDPTDSRDKRPVATIVGSVLLACRSVASVLLAGSIVLSVVRDPASLTSIDPTVTSAELLPVVGVVVAIIALFVIADVLLARLVFLGRNWARVTGMFFSLIAIAAQAVSVATGGPEITLRTNLVGVCLDVLLMMALSSDRARIWARRSRKAPKRISGRPGNSAAF
jgi:hypothetical protein